MNIGKLAFVMISFETNTRGDVNHLMKVWSFARTLGEMNNLSQRDQQILETAALLHDAACPVLRGQPGAQALSHEKSSAFLARSHLSQASYGEKLDDDFIDRVVFLIEHHHDGAMEKSLLLQCLYEAEFLVTLDEQGALPETVRRKGETLIKTQAGKFLLKRLFRDEPAAAPVFVPAEPRPSANSGGYSA